MDVTEHKKYEQNLIVHSQMISRMAEGVYLVRLSDGIIVETNNAFDKMFGYQRGEMIGKNVSIVNAPADESPGDKAARILKIIEKTGEWKGEIKNIKKDGTEFWSHANVSVFDHPEHGRVLLDVHLDISERKKAEFKYKGTQ